MEGSGTNKCGVSGCYNYGSGVADDRVTQGAGPKQKPDNSLLQAEPDFASNQIMHMHSEIRIPQPVDV
jgi:hypothetical protein